MKAIFKHLWRFVSVGIIGRILLMAQDLSVRELVGSNALSLIGPFGELEAAVAATTELRLCGATFDAAGPPTMLYPGVIVGMSAACEASSNFTVQVTKNGTPDTGVTMTVNAATEVQKFLPSEYVEFAAGDTIGANCIADTTSKDVSVYLWVIFDTSLQ